MQQFGALPYRIAESGELQVLLITSRRSHRWLIPKGNPIKGLKAHEVAAREAFEEAGVRGKARKKSLGKFHYDRLLADGAEDRAEVVVFPLQVTDQLQDWPERAERTRRWLSPIAASHLVEIGSLKRLLLIAHLDGLA